MLWQPTDSQAVLHCGEATWFLLPPKFLKVTMTGLLKLLIYGEFIYVGKDPSHILVAYKDTKLIIASKGTKIPGVDIENGRVIPINS